MMLSIVAYVCSWHIQSNAWFEHLFVEELHASSHIPGDV